MKIERVTINGMNNPMGFLLDTVRCAWVVSDTLAKRAVYTRIMVSTQKEFHEILWKKEGKNLNQTGELLEIEQKPYTRYYVKVQVTGENGERAENAQEVYFETGKMDTLWVGKWIKPQEEDSFHPIFIKEFQVEKEIAQARLYISGVGLYEARLNSQKIGKEVLTPYFSDYHTECQYQTYDITERLQTDNRLEVELGNGWYKGHFGLGFTEHNYGNEFQMIAEVHFTYADGTSQVIASDNTWNYIGSDVEESDIYNGETINHLLWENKENTLKEPIEGDVEGRLVERYSLPVFEQEHLQVKEVLSTPAGETVLDFGQNFAGYVAFSSNLPRGTQVTLDFGEIMQNGNFYKENYRKAKSRFIYKSDGRTGYVKPAFTYFGFRYVRVSGWNGTVDPKDFTGIALYSDMRVTGHLETAHAGINQLFSNTMWGQKSNSIDIPTDCPQRDERLGWTGDVQVFSNTASYNMDTAAFYHKFIHDLQTEQKKYDGILPGVIPVLDPNGPIFSSVWGDIATFLPMVLYEHYGDLAALKQYYPMMKAWVDKIEKEDQKRGQRYLFDFGNQLGDWLAQDGRTTQSMKGGTDDSYIASCYYAESVKKTANAARILGKKEEELYYRNLYKQIYEAILKEYFSQSGRLCIDTQTGYIVALNFGIYKEKTKVIEGLRSRLYKDCFKLKGGFVGAPIMCRVMAENGLVEEAFYFLLQEGYPGWLHCVNLGATTIWERFNSVLEDGTISGTLMNSLNHFSFGTIMEFLYRDVAGIKPLEPGFKKVEIAPLMNQKLKYMKSSYDSSFGTYRVEWEIKEDGKVRVFLEIPFGAKAMVDLPFYPEEIGELEAGKYEYLYRPTQDLRCSYSKKTLFKEMMQDERAMEIIDRVSPLLHNFLSAGEEDFLNESIETLKGMAFLGFSEEVIETLSEELTHLEEGSE